MLQKRSIFGGMIFLALMLNSCSAALPQVAVEPTEARATELPAQTALPTEARTTEPPAQTALPTLDLPVKALNQQMFEVIRNDDAEQLSLLIASGADIETKDPFTGATPLIIASYRGNVAVIETLLSAKADVNSADRGGITPLMGAAQFGHAALIPILLKAGAKLETLSSSLNHQNALHFAAKDGHPEVVDALLNAGANVDALENTHSTALMYAAYWGHTDVVKILLEHGADTTIRDQVGYIAADWAKMRGFPEISQLIETSK